MSLVRFTPSCVPLRMPKRYSRPICPPPSVPKPSASRSPKLPSPSGRVKRCVTRNALANFGMRSVVGKPMSVKSGSLGTTARSSGTVWLGCRRRGSGLTGVLGLAGKRPWRGSSQDDSGCNQNLRRVTPHRTDLPSGACLGANPVPTVAVLHVGKTARQSPGSLRSANRVTPHVNATDSSYTVGAPLAGRDRCGPHRSLESRRNALAQLSRCFAR